ncbi:SAYSvFN domain-containing protein 1-like isoform X2 [Pollicipes pollicipes]|nr:SAYSvFN domain-containing protein 1-like isoform X2 [Pollicipes pollicipes]XP_037093310.1 SAYSvFN domain-containing protein 1-like isoform X2 [Pollicipes pollicipes]XP_037093311.1 SAYSvFN domain-containing protein 1-like isoform X2 [Pollicipes pollicipes]
MEAKLEAYRAEKRRQREAEKRKEWLSEVYRATTGLIRRNRPAQYEPSVMPGPLEDQARAPATDQTPPSASSWLDRAILVCKVGLYLTLFAISCHFQFGAAFVVVTAIPIIYFSTGTRGRRPDEASAYSVFNPDCEAIDGTLTGEQFQREIMYGPGAT